MHCLPTFHGLNDVFVPAPSEVVALRGKVLRNGEYVFRTRIAHPSPPLMCMQVAVLVAEAQVQCELADGKSVPVPRADPKHCRGSPMRWPRTNFVEKGAEVSEHAGAELEIDDTQVGAEGDDE